ncbi:hypothetical protein Wxf_00006 [Armadillidium vulgare]|nr:hypothetical protein Wxf_00006 [Armadillidium vulgare] [Wolbachia endosymbiont of Armadillidium vulgare]
MVSVIIKGKKSCRPTNINYEIFIFFAHIDKVSSGGKTMTTTDDDDDDDDDDGNFSDSQAKPEL